MSFTSKFICRSSLGKFVPCSLRFLSMDVPSRNRKWIKTHCKTVNDDGNVFTVMSYNILSDALMKGHPELYDGVCDPNDLEWRLRWSRILDEIRSHDPDIIALQEVQHDHYEEFISPSITTRLTETYDAIYKRRTSDKNDGCAIFYKTDKFRVTYWTSVEYNQNKKSLDRDNVGIIAKFYIHDSKNKSNNNINNKEEKEEFVQDDVNGSKSAVNDSKMTNNWRNKMKFIESSSKIPSENSKTDSKTASSFVVATTHLLYNPRRYDVRISQSVLLLAELDRVAYCGTCPWTGKPSYLPTIVTGDFNAEVNSDVLRFWTDGKGLVEDPEVFRGLEITDKCVHRHCEQDRKKTNKQSKRRDKIHYSMVSKLNPNLFHSTLTPTPTSILSSSTSRTSPEYVFTHNFGFRSTDYHDPRGVTTKHVYWTKVDFILYSTQFHRRYQKFIERKLKLISVLKCPSKFECQQIGGFPNQHYPSDHISLLAKFCLTT